MNRWLERLSQNIRWGMGQLELYKTSQEFVDKIDIIQLDEKYNDLGGTDRPNAFADDSIIWHCKQSHFEHPKFQEEFQKYLDIGKQLYYGG